MAIPLDAYATQAPVRQPGDFKRKGTDGPPYVASLTKTRQPKGNKAELVDKVMQRGLDPLGLTVPQLKELLGPEPADDLYGRPSGFGDPLENSYALRKYIERGIAHGVVRLVLDGFDPSTVDLDNADALDRLVTDAQAAVDSMIWADRGTHVHSLVERYETGQSWDDLIPAGEALGIPEALQRAIVDAWIDFHDEIAVTLDCELAIVNDRARIAGTADLLDVARVDIETEFGTITAGQAFIGDIKTGEPRDKYAVQVCGYVDGVPYDTETDERGDWPQQPHANVGLIYHMSMKAVLDGAPPVWQAIPVDLAVGRDGARICCEARDWPSADVFGAPIEIAAPSAARADDEQRATGPEVSADLGLVAPTADPNRRDALRERQTRMAANANDTGWGVQFAAQWASFGITPESTDDEIQAALDAIEPPFDVVTELTPPEQGGFIHDTPIEIDNGGPLDDASLDALMATIKASPARAVVNGWLKQSADAKDSWSPRHHRTVRHFEISRAALALALAADGDDEYARLILATAIGSDLPPTVEVGRFLASLSIDEARRTTGIAEAFGNRLTLQFSDDGQPLLIGDVAAIVAAA